MIIMAVFVIVVMGMLALSLSRMQWSNQDILTRDVLGTRAWFLAHSGNEWALTKLFPLDGEETDAALSTRCSNISGEAGSDAVTTILSGSQLSDICSDFVIQCDAPGMAVPDDLKFYKVVSTVTCGSGKYQVKRSQEIWVKGMENDS
jgi:MSHA biogenesis protein MshP